MSGSKQLCVLRRAREDDLPVLMTWFQSADNIRIWSGPGFRFPFDAATFRADAHFDDMDSFVLDDADGVSCGFGQIYDRNAHMNLARLVVDPRRRGEGLGRELVTGLLAIAPQLFPLDRYSLFVYRHNLPALELYRSLGFGIQKYPPDQKLADECWFLTRALDSAG